MKATNAPARGALLAFLAAFSALSLALDPSPARAQSDEDDAELMDYDAIVRELSHTGASHARPSKPDSDPFASILLHGGVGLASTFSTFSHQGQKVRMGQRGFQAAFGIDLFSDHWLAEGAARSFSRGNHGRLGVGLKEFDLKVYYRERMTTAIGMRVGAGLAARYLTVSDPGAADTVFSTPSTILALGGEYFIGRSLSVGAELSARHALIGETVDRNAVDATVRLDTHF